jgi:transcription-repair coupling factor (superfamily II helicase)
MDLFNEIIKVDLNNNGIICTNNELNAIYIYSVYKEQNKDLLVITNSLYEANKLYDSLANYTDKVYLFPMDDFLTSEALAISPDLKIKRVETINNLLINNKKIVVTHLMGFLRFLPTKINWQNSLISLEKNIMYNKKQLVEDLIKIGYEKQTLVSQTGEFSSRGFIVDLFPINESYPIRIEFFDDYIESIRYFDVDNQKSIKTINNIIVYPTSEFIVAVEVEENMKKQKNIPLYLEEYTNIMGYLNDPIVIFKDYNQIKNAYSNLKEDIFNYDLNSNNKNNFDYMYNLEDIIVEKRKHLMTIDNFVSDEERLNIIKLDSKEVNDFNSNINQIKNYLEKNIDKGKTIVICFRTESSLKRFKKYIDVDLNFSDERNILHNKINLIIKNINQGFEYEKIVVITENELFNTKDLKQKYYSNFKYSSKIKDINKLHIGDYIVHNIHGIGIYNGIITLTKNGLKKDYLEIKYLGSDKLYIPVEKIDLISKYSAKEGVRPKVNKLGSIEWSKTKTRIKNKIKDVAIKLLKLSAEREAKKGFPFSKDKEDQIMFDQDFIYEETKDQLLAIKQIKKDMESERPMDRLLCGDVGYGKTEVAFRAMFKAVLNNKQVAYLCPTTILSNQQYNNAMDRFKKFAINIRLLNRFTKKKEQQEIINGIKTGNVDILIGTHRILSEDIKFKDIGLLIIDEEQRFGVMHKEKIKEFKINVDVLTLSATPIPRTLQMSMVGLRDLSLIETPPVNRYPIQTYVIPYNKQIIKEAIYRELSRGGQVFVLNNKIENIELQVLEIKRIVPEAKVTFAHGKMSKTDLEDIMLSFINKEYDVLVCTTIIETGIDISNANTLIIIDADRFGLSQLYQIRGRVGRSDKIAYAYLMYDDRKVLNEIAIKRLQVIKEFTELGSGFSIAVRDLSIRGAGDILGSEQAGFIDSVGIELYTKMLNDEVLKLKGEKIEIINESKEEEKPLINVATHISDNYVEDEELKIEIHKKINLIDSYESLLLIKSELEDRFGNLPIEIIIYMYEEWFEKVSKKNGIIKVIENRNSIELIFSKEISTKINGDKIFMDAYKISPMFRFAYKEEKFRIIIDTIKLEDHWLFTVMKLIEKIDNYIN